MKIAPLALPHSKTPFSESALLESACLNCCLRNVNELNLLELVSLTLTHSLASFPINCRTVWAKEGKEDEKEEPVNWKLVGQHNS